ncbi:SMC-Scp complex subunit ScpB [Thiohalocapsa sp. ML1]|jgi:segregation and condensation protein B|uniref:SMC-Scp complex subunit ScpB n=1 Tax=Thiohalocapsa sp. ML1 TaxID=1431688 RepID=UPI0009E8A7E4|nr:SMC-Scp complex subunit ScpB [Thiohalocapsa sp. ML1]
MSGGDWEQSGLEDDDGDIARLNALTLAAPDVKLVVEGALMAAGAPLTLDQILALYPEERRPARDEIKTAVAELMDDYAGRGIELVEVAGGWRIQVRRLVAPWVARLWDEKPQRYSRALLETLALIAYRQPITRGEIEDIRGVAVSTQIVKTLTEREWVRVVGHRDVPGRPALFATTRRFLDYFGLRSLNDLPPLAELRDPAFFGEQLDAAFDAAVASAAAEAGVTAALPDAAAAPASGSAAAAPQDASR